MNWRSIVAPAVGVAATVATGGLVDPVAGAALAAGLVGGKWAKDQGKRAERRTGRPVAKAAAPAAALAAPTASLLLAERLGIDLEQTCEITHAVVELVCGHPAAAGGLLAGAGAILVHTAAAATKAATKP